METTMLGSAAYLFSDDFIRYEGKPNRAIPDSGQYGLSALYRLYRTRDGWVFLACVKDREWHALCEAVDRNEWLSDSRFATEIDRRVNDAALAKELEALFLSAAAIHWESELQAVDVPCVVASDTWSSFLFADEGKENSQLVTEFEVADLGRLRQNGPAILMSDTDNTVGVLEDRGASGSRILKSIGYTDEQIGELKARGVLS